MKTILVVDDSKTARLTLKRKLDLQNYQVEMADSGEAAIELLQHSAPPALIFMDVLMGNMSGYEAAAEILKLPAMRDVPIVMCTSKDSQEDRDEAAKNGAKGFIIKPISDEALEQVLRELVIERVQTAPQVEIAHVAEEAPVAEAPPVLAQPQFVITAELESLVRQMVEQANLQRAEEAASQVVHAALGEHLHQVEDILEGKISILSSSLAALHTAHDRAQAEHETAQRALLEAMPKEGSSEVSERIADQITQQLREFEAEEHSKRAIHELEMQSRLEKSLQGQAEHTAQSAAERMMNQALGSHFAMMDERLNALGNELTALKSAPQAAAAPQFDEQAMLTRLEAMMDRRMNDALPQLVASHASEQLAAHITASDEKFQSIKQELSAGIKAVSEAVSTQTMQAAAPAVPVELPSAWMQQLLSKQDEMLEQRFNVWNAQIDERIAASEQALVERMNDKVSELSLQAETVQPARETPPAGAAQPQPSGSKLALGLAALGVVLALIALLT